jgi:membrane protein insertase Oxa1/YidC/SpoIIIJ
LSEIPWFFQPLKPYIHLARDQIFTLNQAVGLPWWVIIMITSLVARATIFPLIFVQMKKISRIGPVWPIFAHIKEGWKDSNLPVGEKIKISWQLYRKLANQ